jgi:hypothetical protein
MIAHCMIAFELDQFSDPTGSHPLPLQHCYNQAKFTQVTTSGATPVPAPLRQSTTRAFKHPSVFALFTQSREVYDANGIMLGIPGITQPQYQTRCPSCSKQRKEKKKCIHDSSLGHGTYCKIKLRPRMRLVSSNSETGTGTRRDFATTLYPMMSSRFTTCNFAREYEHEIASIRSVADSWGGWVWDQSHANAAAFRLTLADMLGVPRASVLA